MSEVVFSLFSVDSASSESLNDENLSIPSATQEQFVYKNNGIAAVFAEFFVSQNRRRVSDAKYNFTAARVSKIVSSKGEDLTEHEKDMLSDHWSREFFLMYTQLLCYEGRCYKIEADITVYQYGKGRGSDLSAAHSSLQPTYKDNSYAIERSRLIEEGFTIRNKAILYSYGLLDRDISFLQKLQELSLLNNGNYDKVVQTAVVRRLLGDISKELSAQQEKILSSLGLPLKSIIEFEQEWKETVGGGVEVDLQKLGILYSLVAVLYDKNHWISRHSFAFHGLNSTVQTAYDVNLLCDGIIEKKLRGDRCDLINKVSAGDMFPYTAFLEWSKKNVGCIKGCIGSLKSVIDNLDEMRSFPVDVKAFNLKVDASIERVKVMGRLFSTVRRYHKFMTLLKKAPDGFLSQSDMYMHFDSVRKLFGAFSVYAGILENLSKLNEIKVDSKENERYFEENSSSLGKFIKKDFILDFCNKLKALDKEHFDSYYSDIYRGVLEKAKSGDYYEACLEIDNFMQMVVNDKVILSAIWSKVKQAFLETLGVLPSFEYNLTALIDKQKRLLKLFEFRLEVFNSIPGEDALRQYLLPKKYTSLYDTGILTLVERRFLFPAFIR